MARFGSIGYWQETDRFSGKVVLSGETFTCAHCGRVKYLEFGETPAMCDHEWLPLCAACSAAYHLTLKCEPREEKLRRFEGRVKRQEQRLADMRGMGFIR